MHNKELGWIQYFSMLFKIIFVAFIISGLTSKEKLKDNKVVLLLDNCREYSSKSNCVMTILLLYIFPWTSWISFTFMYQRIFWSLKITFVVIFKLLIWWILAFIATIIIIIKFLISDSISIYFAVVIHRKVKILIYFV